MSRANFKNQVSSMSVDQRIEKAKIVTKSLTYKVLEVIDLNEANKIIGYGDKLRSQIPASNAGHAFNTFQSAMFNYEVIKCIALWDAAEMNAISIPTVTCPPRLPHS